MERNTEPTDALREDDIDETLSVCDAADVLARYLTGNTVDTESSAALESVCARPWALIGIGSTPRRGQADAMEIKRIATSSPVQCVVAHIGNNTIVFVSYAEVRHLIDGTLDKGKLAKCPMCISLPFESLAGIPEQYDLVSYCLDNSTAAEVYDARNSALTYLVTKMRNAMSVETLLHPALGILERYDAVNRSNLLNTLEVYLENDRNAQQCANKLYLHRNSLQYRVRRIQEIAGIDLDNPKERSYLRLSFLLRS